jgi:signal transduction histidine kinase
MSAIAEATPADARSGQGQHAPKTKVKRGSRFAGRLLAWAADVRWRDGLAIVFTAGAVAGSAAVVARALSENNNTLVILAAVAGLLTVAGQTAIRHEVVEIIFEFKRLLDGTVGTIEADDLAIRGDKSRIWLHWRATAVRRRNGSFEHFVMTFEDSSQKHLAEAAAHANLAELEKLDHMKTEFTSMVSHEFRTALTGIQGMSELINGGQVSAADVHEYSGYIFQEAERVTG